MENAVKTMTPGNASLQQQSASTVSRTNMRIQRMKHPGENALVISKNRKNSVRPSHTTKKTCEWIPGAKMPGLEPKISEQ